MDRKFDLNRMLKEVEEDEDVDKKTHQQLSQPEIRRVFSRKKLKKGAPKR